MVSLGLLIKRLRTEMGYNNRVFAEKAGVHFAQLSRYESGNTELKDEKCIDLMVKGFKMSREQARDVVLEFKVKQGINEMSEEGRERFMSHFIVKDNGTVIGKVAGNYVNNSFDQKLIDTILEKSNKDKAVLYDLLTKKGGSDLLNLNNKELEDCLRMAGYLKHINKKEKVENHIDAIEEEKKIQTILEERGDKIFGAGDSDY